MLALSDVSFDVDLPLGGVDGADSPYLQRVYPGVGWKRCGQPGILTQLKYRASFFRRCYSIGKKGNLLIVLGGNFTVNVQVRASIGSNIYVVDSFDRALKFWTRQRTFKCYVKTGTLGGGAAWPDTMSAMLAPYSVTPVKFKVTS